MATTINVGLLAVNALDYSGNKKLQSINLTVENIKSTLYGYMIPYADLGLGQPSASLTFVEASVIPTSGFTAAQITYMKDDGFGKVLIASATKTAFIAGLNDTAVYSDVPVVTAEGFSKAS